MLQTRQPTNYTDTRVESFRTKMVEILSNNVTTRPHGVPDAFIPPVRRPAPGPPHRRYDTMESQLPEAIQISGDSSPSPSFLAFLSQDHQPEPDITSPPPMQSMHAATSSTPHQETTPGEPSTSCNEWTPYSNVHFCQWKVAQKTLFILIIVQRLQVMSGRYTTREGPCA